MARNRQRAKERQARRKAKQGDGAAPDGAQQDGVVSGDRRPSPSAEPTREPELTESELLRAGAPPQDTGFSAETLEYEQDLDATRDGDHFDPEEDVPEEDLTADGAKRRSDAAKHGGRPRFVQFLVASWAELQRVQWPDRQALTTLTGVVLGFVLIAGGYLGLLDAVASRVIQAIL